MKKLSIIIPVYNVEKYIDECIMSVLNQKNKDFEIILIDDGSPDKCPEICDEYAKKYDNIKCYHKSNGGLSSARNMGIQKATGEYVMFIDSDDYLYSKDCISKIINAIDNTKSDIIQYKMIYYYSGNDKYKKISDIDIPSNDKSYMDILNDNIKNGTLSISACDKVIKRSLIVNNKIFFDETLLSEDIDWSLKLYLYTSSLFVLNEDIYVYRQQRKGSISSKMSKKNVESLYRIIDRWQSHESYPDNRYKEMYSNYLAYQYVILLTRLSKDNSNKEMKKKIFEMKDILKYSENYKVQLSNKLFNVFGMHLGRYFLKLYIAMKNIGVLKI